MVLLLATASPVVAAPQRPPQQYKPRIMPMGDSLTVGWNPLDPLIAQGGYRAVLNDYLNNRVDWVGRQQHGPPEARNHEGWGGYQIRRYQDLALAGAMAQQPDIVLLMLGTNDAWHPGEYDALSTRENMVPNLVTFLDKLYSYQPDVKVILSTLPDIHYDGSDAIRAYNAAMPGIVAQMTTSGRQIHLVDAFSRVTLDDTWTDTDGIHPNALGYRHIADAFISDPWLRNARYGPLLPSNPNRGNSIPEPATLSLLVLPMLWHRRGRKMYP